MTEQVDKELVAEILEQVGKMSLDDVKTELELMGAEEVAEKLKFGLSTIYSYAKEGIIPAAWWGSGVRFRPRALLAFQIYKERRGYAEPAAA
jgi:excisionase family DNA binding protein